MLIALPQFCVSAAIIIVSGIVMARTADAISRVTGLGQFFGGGASGRHRDFGSRPVGWHQRGKERMGGLGGRGPFGCGAHEHADSGRSRHGAVVARPNDVEDRGGARALRRDGDDLAGAGRNGRIRPGAAEHHLRRRWRWTLGGGRRLFSRVVWSSSISSSQRSRPARIRSRSLSGLACSSRPWAIFLRS